MKHEKCYLCLRTRVTLVPGPYTPKGGKVFVGSLQKPTFRFARLENQGGSDLHFDSPVNV